MSPARGDGEFERRLEHELRRTLAAVRGPSPRAEQAAYRATRSRGRPVAARPALLRRGAVGLVVAALALGAASAVAVGTGSQIPAELARSASQIVRGCWAGQAAGGQTAGPARDGGAACPASPLDHGQGAAGQQPAGGGSDTGSQAGAAGPSAAHGNHGQGGGSTGQADGQGHGGGNGQGNAPAGRPSPEPSDRGHGATRGSSTAR